MHISMPKPSNLLNAINLAYNPALTARARLELAKQSNWVEKLPSACEKITQWHETALAWLDDEQAHAPRAWISIHSPKYPKGLFELKDPPLILFAEGKTDLLQVQSVAMVGSRNASNAGLKTAQDFSKVFAQEGWCVVSGLAEGIDGASHLGALSHTDSTIAILGGGLDQIYPRCHIGLAQKLLERGGLMLSEYPPGTSPQPAFFPRRNRLIAAVSDGLLVVEAALRSGSLITARVASELGRPVMAIPGSIHSPHSKGCHAMIKKGALLVETASEVLNEISSTLDITKISVKPHSSSINADGTSNNAQHTHLNDELSFILNELSFDPMTLDMLVLKTAQSSEDVLAALTELELESLVVCEPGNKWMRVS